MLKRERIYHIEIEIKDKTDTAQSASYFKRIYHIEPDKGYS